MKLFWFRTIYILFFGLLGGTVFSQTIVKGMVSTESKESLPGANIFIEGTYDGTSSDATGYFFFETAQIDSVFLHASFIGFKDFSKWLYLEGDTIHLDIILQEKINYLKEVVISAGTFEAG